MKRWAAAATAACAVAIGGTVSTAHGAEDSHWYWTSGLCKAKLHNYGVAIGDGRTYNVQQAFCVGAHDHCWLDGGARRFKVFYTAMRSYDGVVRTMTLTVTGKDSWSGSKLRLYSRNMSVGEFNYEFGTAAWAVASQQNATGCWDLHP